MGSVSPLVFTELQPEMRGFVLFAAVFQLCQGAPQVLLGHPYGLHYAVPVHEVPGLVPALAVQKQESSGDVSLSTGTGHLVPTLAHGVYYGKREAEADPAVLYSSVAYSHPAYTPYAHHYPYTYGAYPYTYGAYSYWG